MSQSGYLRFTPVVVSHFPVSVHAPASARSVLRFHGSQWQPAPVPGGPRRENGAS